MANRGADWGRIERENVGGERNVRDYTIRPVARIVGLKGTAAKPSETGQGTGAGAALLVKPVAALVSDEDGNEVRLRVTDPSAQAIRGMLMAGALIAVLGTAVTLGARPLRSVLHRLLEQKGSD
jgi:hypothetical protein